MLKDRLFLLGLFVFFIQVSSCQVANTTDAQVSKDTKDSKNNGFFIKKYAVDSCSDKTMMVEDVWLEKIWFNKVDLFNKVTKTVGPKGSQLCFKLKQTSQLAYKPANILNWKMKNPKTRAYVGITFGAQITLYHLTFQNYDVPDTISLDLLKHIDSASVIKDVKVGTLRFRAVVEKPKAGK